MDIPETRYAMNGDLAVAYQVFGSGPDWLVMPNWLWNVEAVWDLPEMRRWLEACGSFCRVIHFDQPGTGNSDPISLESPPTLEQWIDSARVVLDATQSDQANIVCVDGAAPAGALFSATYPGRTKSLVIADGYARLRQADDYPLGIPDDVANAFLEGMVGVWGTGELQRAVNFDAPWNEETRRVWARFERQIGSPKIARQMFGLLFEIDVRNTLSSVQAPTLVIHHEDNPIVDVALGRYLAEHISQARLHLVPGRNLYPVFNDWREILDEIREFITGTRGDAVDEDRMLSTVLFTDIVDSTRRASELGDAGWRALLDAHDALVRSQLVRFRGREVKTVGDGFLATFDGPQRAIRCAVAIRDALKPLGIQVRSGLHTGECEIRGEDVGGIAVHIGSRVSTLAEAQEVLVSSTVKDLVTGSGIEFEDRGTHELKGVPGEWRLFAVHV
jgi:class 3 adenylate cyclase